MPRLSSATFPVALPRTAALAVGLALLLTGCQGGSPPGLQTSESGSTTVSPTSSSAVPAASATSSAPSPSAVYKPADAKGKAQNVPVPVMPELAKENSKAGLEAFIGYWYATYSYAIETGELGAWKKITDTTLPVAVAHEASVNLNYKAGRWMAGGTLKTPVIDVLWNESESGAISAKVQVIQEAIQYFDADGSKGQNDSAGSNTADALFASYTGGAWKVTNYGTIVG
ncbi:DUF6318 family protein [Arthrobacter sp. StoSoilB20]|uniref:DUF6318 family protein n=1 Tax=Arthrobacter sp. StoSoilB20 TaxID=2830995 RepID=UPI001CC79623|nr:DUF6318 family protein [Arthrobacter sp. StoSoilB20]